MLLGSTERDNTADWINIGGNVWSTTSPLSAGAVSTGNELLPNPSFSTDASCWTLTPGVSGVAGARDTNANDYDTAPACYKVTSGSTTPTSSTKLTTQGTSSSNYINVTANQIYQLTFRAKYGGTQFTLPSDSTSEQFGHVDWHGADDSHADVHHELGELHHHHQGHQHGHQRQDRFHARRRQRHEDELPVLSRHPVFLSRVTVESELLQQRHQRLVVLRQHPHRRRLFARTTTSGQYQSSPAGGEVTCTSTGSGSAYTDIQLSTTGISVAENQYFLLTFWAKSSTAFTMPDISLSSGTSGAWYGNVLGAAPAITTSWASYSVLFRCNTTATDGRITFYLGDSLPASATFYVDTLSFKLAVPTDGRRFPDIEVGNIIFNNGQSVGQEQSSQSDLANQGDFYYDAGTWTVKLYSTTNPASAYSDLELALNENIIDESSQHYVTYQNLDLSDGAGCGINGYGTGTYNITVTGCNISYIGGGMLQDAGGWARYGNGIQFWGDAHDNLVENCKLWEIYDTALTNQSSGACDEYNITYRNNIIWNCSSSYEFWIAGTGVTPQNSSMHDIYFENNTCVDAGTTWATYPVDQRTPGRGEGGESISSRSNGAAVYDYYIRNNIIYGATYGALSIAYWGASSWNDLANLTLDYNLYEPEFPSLYIIWCGTGYWHEQFSLYQSVSGEDAHSITASPEFVDEPNHDYHLLPSSPAIDAGTNTGIATDYDGTARPQGAAYDIGAYEYTPLPMVTDVLVASSAWSSGFLNSLGEVGYAIPDGPNQLLPLPGSNLNEVIIEFNKDVDVTEGDLALTGVNVPSYGFSAFSYDAVAHRATWTLSQNLVRDKLLVDLDGSTANAVVDAVGNRLDGDWVNPTWSPPSAPTGGDAWPSGDGTAGGDFQFRINVLPGDINQDGTVSVEDLAILAANYRKSLTGWANGDLNCDGVVDVSDLAVLAANYRLGLPVPEPVAPAPAPPVAQPAKSLAAAAPVVLSSSTTNGSAHSQVTASRLGKVASAHRHVFHLMGSVEDDRVVVEVAR